MHHVLVDEQTLRQKVATVYGAAVDAHEVDLARGIRASHVAARRES
jgi:hypothetical protein